MVAAVEVFRNNITDVALSGQAGPAVQAEDLVLLRRHDPDNPTDGLILAVVQLDPSAVGSMEDGQLKIRVGNRSGGGPTPSDTITLDATTTGPLNPRLAVLLGSRSQAELDGNGGPAFAGAIGALPAGLTLNTTFERYNQGNEITFSNDAPLWVFWGGIYGQDFSDAFDVTYAWQAA